MVDYGHYAFRAPTPLARFDPSVDAVTGKAIALLALVTGLRLPALFGSGLAIAQGESALAALPLFGAY